MNWNVYPKGWMAEGRRSMLSHIDGLNDWCVECAEFNDHELYGRPEWRHEYELGYRYYVLKYNLYDTNKQSVEFYTDPNDAQEAFEKARDPIGKRSKVGAN